MDGVSNNYINNAINELTTLLGVKDPIADQTILKSFRAGNIKACTEKIANYLGLHIVVSLSYVSAQYQQRNAGNRFESTGLAQTGHASGGVEGITAQVSIPSYLPSYGTSALENFPIAVKISDNCLNYPQTFMAIMAHELSHVLLHALRHREKDNEFYVDLTAMILGFSRVLKNGRKVVETKSVQTKDYVLYSESVTETVTTTYGYLSDQQFKLAFDKIDKILKKYINSYVDSKEKLIKRLTDYKKQILSYRQQLLTFGKFIDYVDKKRVRRMAQEDATKMIAFHQPGYTDRFATVLRSNEEKHKQSCDSLSTGLSKLTHSHYTKETTDSLRMFCENVDALLSSLEQESVLLKNDIAVLKKYVGFFNRF